MYSQWEGISIQTATTFSSVSFKDDKLDQALESGEL